MQKEDPEFKKNWEVTIKESEQKLIDTLIRHLTGVIIDTHRALRQDYRQTSLNLKAMDPVKAKPELAK